MNVAGFDRILRNVLLVPLVAILLGAGILLWQMRITNATVAEIQSSDERILQVVSIESLIVDEETGLRGYETTHDPVFLDSFRAAEAILPQALKNRQALARTPERRAAFQALTSDYEAWHSGFAEPLIATIESGGHTEDLELNLQGKRQMDGIRQRLADLNTLTMQRRDQYIRTWHHQVRLLSFALIAVAILLGLLIGFYIRASLRKVSGAFRQSHNALRIRAQQAFRSEQKLRTTLHSIGEAVVTCSPEGAIESMNLVAEQLTGWKASEALTKPLETVFRIVDEHTREPIENPVALVIQANHPIPTSDHILLLRRDGTEIYIDDSAAPIRDKNGKILGIVLVFRDITLARKSQQALVANEKLAVAGRLAATIAHEIHNPLDSISNLLFLMDGESTPEESAQFLALARQETARVTQISRAMLSLYRESKTPVPIDLKEMLESVLLLMDRRFQTLGVTLTTDLPPGLIIHGFPAELRQVFTNLLTNAAEACTQFSNQPSTSTSPLIEITAEPTPAGLTPEGLRHPPGATICIHDNGPGIAPDILANLFQAFYTTKGERGTGLGLWVSRGIISKHGGTIQLFSATQPENHGTTAEVFLATNPTINPT